MKYNRYISYILLAFTALGCAREPLPAIKEEEAPQETVQELVPGMANVKFDETMIELIESDLEAGNIVTKSSELNGLKEMLGIKSMVRVFPHAGEFEERTRAAGLHRWYRVEFDTEIPVTKATADFSAIPGVVSVDPVRNIKRTSTFDDPRLKYQWHYYNDGSLDSRHKAGADINVVPVWENYTTGNPDVIVAVVDGGIDAQHEDIKPNYLKGRSFCNGESNVVPHDHGTHVAGTIAAVNNNGIGVSGIAGGDAANGVKGVRLISCQIFAPDPDDPGSELGGDGAQAIKWGADNGAVISQNSWGWVYATEEDAKRAGTIAGTPLADAIDYFIANAGKDAAGNQVGPMNGGIVIFASGNDGWAHDPIGKYEPILSVGAISPDYTRTAYSNYGPWVDIAAPGGSSDYTMGGILSTIAGGYGYMQGTSMACPHVSGVAALIVAHHGGPGFTPAMLRERLIKGGNSSVMSKNAQLGPLVDAHGAITYGGKTPPQKVAEVGTETQSNNAMFSWTVTSDPDDNKAWGYRLIASKDKSVFSGLKPGSLPETVVYADVLTGSIKVGEQMTGIIPGLEFETEYHVAVAAFDFRRNYSALSSVRTIMTKGNTAPEIKTDYNGDFKVKSHEVLSVVYNVADPDGHDISVEYTPAGPADAWVLGTDGKYRMTVTGNADEPGKYTAKIKVTDAYGLSTTKDVVYEILENNAPVIVKDIEDKFFDQAGLKLQIDMAEYLDDPDGEQLKFDIKISNKAVLHINQAENILHATSLMYGTTDVTIVASDARDLKCTLTFKVVVKDPAKPLEVYPNPVVDWLNISTMEVQPTHVVIVSSTGQTVYDQTMDIGAVDPARIDMTAFAPGTYGLYVSFSGTDYRRTIVKL